MKTIRLGLIGTGLMGREIASAVARWCHLEDTGVRPVITALCGRTLPPARVAWFREHFPSLRLVTADHRELAAKFHECAGAILDETEREHALDLCARLETLDDVSRLADAVRADA